MPKRKLAAFEGGGQTVTVKLADVPEYLQNGELFRSMQSEAEEDESSHDAGEIEVPVNYIKPDQTVATVDDAWSLLHSLRYWIVGTDLPASLVDFCLSPLGKELPDRFWKSFERQFAHVDALRKMARSKAKFSSAILRMAITTGDVRLVHEILQCNLPSNASAVATESGSVACLQYVHERMAGEL
jgi:hypothetical protein